MKHASLYDRLAHAGAKLFAKLKDPFNSRNRGEARMAGLIGSYGTSRIGTNRLWDKFNQVSHYRSWVARCVEFLSEGVRVPPEIVKVTKAGERERYGVATKQWRAKGCVGDPPSYRAFLSRVRSKAAVGPVKAHEEYEFLPDDSPPVRLVNDPNEFQTGIKFWQLCGTYEELTGESFIWVVPNAAGTPVEMWVIPSQWVTPRCDGISGKMVDYFEVRAVNGPVEYFAPEDIIWSKNDSPFHPLYVSSRVQNASTTIDAYEMTETARYTGLENGTMAGGAFKFPPDVQTSQDIIDRLEARLLAKNGGPTNFLRPLILEGGLEWIPPTGDWELAYLQSSDQLRKYIMAHFGLDESMMGFANHSTYAAAVITKNSLFNSVYGPRLENRAAILTECLLPRFGPDLRAIYLPNTTTEDPDAKRADWDVAVRANAVTKNEIRTELLNLEPSEDPAADELPSNPLDALGGDMAGWDQEPGQEKPDGAFGKVPKPDVGTFESGDKGLVNRLADTNGHAKVPKEYTVAELKLKAMKDFEERF